MSFFFCLPDLETAEGSEMWRRTEVGCFPKPRLQAGRLSLVSFPTPSPLPLAFSLVLCCASSVASLLAGTSEVQVSLRGYFHALPCSRVSFIYFLAFGLSFSTLPSH